MSTLEPHVHRAMVTAMVARQILCTVTGRVLDARTCAILVDDDGDPVGVYDPAVLETLTPEQHARLAERGLTIVARLTS